MKWARPSRRGAHPLTWNVDQPFRNRFQTGFIVDLLHKNYFANRTYRSQVKTSDSSQVEMSAVVR